MDDVIWRLETRNGQGWYRSVKDEDRAMIAALAASWATPMPNDDGIPDPATVGLKTSDFLFGFDTVDQARSWFSGGPEPLELWGRERGGVLAAYPRALCGPILHGDHQCAFVPPKDRLDVRMTRPPADLYLNPDLIALVLSQIGASYDVITPSSPTTGHRGIAGDLRAAQGPGGNGLHRRRTMRHERSPQEGPGGQSDSRGSDPAGDIARGYEVLRDLSTLRSGLPPLDLAPLQRDY